MSAGQTILDQLLSQIARACLHKSIEPLHPTATTRIFPTSPNQKGIAQLFAGKLFCQITDLQHLINGHSKVFRLFLHPITEFSARFRRINKVKPEDVFVAFDTNMETIPVIWAFYQIVTALQSYLRGRSKRTGDRRDQKKHDQAKQSP